jgi:N-acetylglucosaminyldiphosphoundecaprenol N-acetyl-beta-D-mannosaminyltransferase
MGTAIGRGQLLGRHLFTAGKDAAYACLLQAARDRRGGAAYFCNVHMLIESLSSAPLAEALSCGEWTFPDGMPLVAALRTLGYRTTERVAGMDAVPELCAACDREKLSVFFYGCDERTLALLQQRLISDHPHLRIAGMQAPPFHARALADEERDVAAIEASGAHLCFVGLGCPKQELWIARHRRRTGAVLLGVGAAFKTTSGEAALAPQWMRDCCLEWAYRLAQEPRRLARRYLESNPIFIDRFLRQLWTR